jgi:uncharacterized membrane protein
MTMDIILDFLFRWAHVLFGITWIGLLYYFNFIQTEYFKEATPEAKGDAVKKLAPRALWWFRWGAMFTFLSGVVLLAMKGSSSNGYLLMGALAGTFMFLNVWLIIWPNQKIVCGLVEGDAAAAAPKAGLASRTNTLLSFPMLMGMLGSGHGAGSDILIPVSSQVSAGFLIAAAVVVAIELNGIFGKMGPMASVRGVIHCGLALTVVLFGVMYFI